MFYHYLPVCPCTLNLKCRQIFMEVAYSPTVSLPEKGIFIPQLLRAVWVLFSPIESGWVGGQLEKASPAVSQKS